MILFLICIEIPIDDISLNKLEKQSMHTPIFLYLFPKNTSKIYQSLKNWSFFSDIYKDDKSILLASIDCSLNNYLCTRFSIKESTFITIFQKFYQRQKISNISVQKLNKLHKKTFINHLAYCQNFIIHNDTSNNFSFQYPTFILNFKGNSSCLELSKYKAIFPQASFYIRDNKPPKKNLYMKIELCNSLSNCISNSHLEPIDFINDFIFDHFGNWNFDDVSKIRRRLVLIVYNDISNSSSKPNKYLPQRYMFEKYIGHYSMHFLFGRFPFTSFLKSVGQLRSLSSTPFMLITNVKKTRFMIVDYKKLTQYQISDKLNAARQGFLELSMEFFFDSKYALQNGYNPQNVTQFAFAAINVIALTVVLILLKTRSCIHIFNRKSESIFFY